MIQFYKKKQRVVFEDKEGKRCIGTIVDIEAVKGYRGSYEYESLIIKPDELFDGKEMIRLPAWLVHSLEKEKE